MSTFLFATTPAAGTRCPRCRSPERPSSTDTPSADTPGYLRRPITALLDVGDRYLVVPEVLVYRGDVVHVELHSLQRAGQGVDVAALRAIEQGASRGDQRHETVGFIDTVVLRDGEADLIDVERLGPAQRPPRGPSRGPGKDPQPPPFRNVTHVRRVAVGSRDLRGSRRLSTNHGPLSAIRRERPCGHGSACHTPSRVAQGKTGW